MAGRGIKVGGTSGVVVGGAKECQPRSCLNADDETADKGFRNMDLELEGGWIPSSRLKFRRECGFKVR